MNLNEHLSQVEQDFKENIDNLLNETRLCQQNLNDKESQIKSVCTEYYAKITENIDLRRDELRLKVDEISSTLKNLVAECKQLNEIKFEAYSSNETFTSDKVDLLESYLNEELRRVVPIKQNFESVQRDLADNLKKLKNKLIDAVGLEKSFREFSLDIHTHSLNFSFMANIEYGSSFYNHLESLSSMDLEAKGLGHFEKYKNWDYKKFEFLPTSK